MGDTPMINGVQATPAQMAEAQRLHAEGKTDAQIAAIMHFDAPQSARGTAIEGKPADIPPELQAQLRKEQVPDEVINKGSIAVLQYCDEAKVKPKGVEQLQALAQQAAPQPTPQQQKQPPVADESPLPAETGRGGQDKPPAKIEIENRESTRRLLGESAKKTDK